jgi:hypothetical protein
MDHLLLQRIDAALRQLEPMAEHAFGPALAIQRQLRWCRDYELGIQGEPAPGPLTMGLIATREFDMYGSQPELAALVNEIQRQVDASRGDQAVPRTRRSWIRSGFASGWAPWCRAVPACGWCLLSVAIGSLLGSATACGALLATGAVLWIPLITSWRNRAARPGAPGWAKAASALCVASTLAGAFSIAERIYLVKGERYPSWLATGTFDSLSEDRLNSFMQNECRSIEIFEKRDMSVIRCGSLWLKPSAKTYIAPANSLQYLIR